MNILSSKHKLVEFALNILWVAIAVILGVSVHAILP